MNPIWVDGDGALVGAGTLNRLDPGSGPRRYHRALDRLRESGSPVAFASFAFDIDEPGSVVVAPEEVEHLRSLPVSEPRPPVAIVDDGVDAWAKGYERAMLAIRAGEVEKVVLARQVVVELPEGFDPAATATYCLLSNT